MSVPPWRETDQRPSMPSALAAAGTMAATAAAASSILRMFMIEPIPFIRLVDDSSVPTGMAGAARPGPERPVRSVYGDGLSIRFMF